MEQSDFNIKVLMHCCPCICAQRCVCVSFKLIQVSISHRKNDAFIKERRVVLQVRFSWILPLLGREGTRRPLPLRRQAVQTCHPPRVGGILLW